MSFTKLGLSAPILTAVSEQGYDTPTPIQEKAIPAIIEGRDIMAAAQTGTGKTAGFTLPLLEKLSKGQKAGPNQARALILAPTRELAAQVAESVELYSKNLPLTSTVVFGGVKINPQMMRLRKGVDVLVATPGRLIDLMGQGAVKFKNLEVLVLDEADRMLDMGFIHDIKRILKTLPAKRQNLMFSATFSDDIRQLAKGLIHNPVEVSVESNKAAKTIEHWIHPVDKTKKPALLTHLIEKNNWRQVLVFTRTKHGANRLVKQLDKSKIEAAAIHGNKSQSARTKALAGFKSGEIRILVATDIVARGLDIDQLPQVVNYDLPNVSEDYVHRIGRTGRAGASGEAISLVTADDLKELSDIERLTQKLLRREIVEGFEPINKVPETTLNMKPIKAKKPKKPKQNKPGDNQGEHKAKRRNGDKTSQATKKRSSGHKAQSKKSTDNKSASQDVWKNSAKKHK
ncbi:DEAD/DEAH box helicase [Pseudoalteromonas sp. C2R02]|uniref:DEAD/DEAH box helicase n=1 Tax=Pseudoalteromonas sp. C2R02 TaxID=2841565 RepID=UPI001C08219D|nr:DEAD/DEAH box helicase [Pseudoalteromonas sp. C2R02]MBU2969757.1 DEAD/DEAH box helicase [Pseudoalteromonas sp. C2R02]